MTDREQIEAIARLVGWKWTSQEMWRTGKEHFLIKTTFADYVPDWLTSLDACKELIEAMRKDGFRVSVSWGTDPGVTPERAICRAYLEFHKKWKD